MKPEKELEILIMLYNKLQDTDDFDLLFKKGYKSAISDLIELRGLNIEDFICQEDGSY